MDTRDSFTLEGWNAEETFAPISYRHQLRGLHQIASKTNHYSQRPPLKLDRLTRRDHKDDSSFLSLKTHKKCYTQEIPKENSDEVKITPNKLKKKELSLDCFQKTQQVCKVFKNIVTLMEKEPSLGSDSPKFTLHHVKKVADTLQKLSNKSRSFEQISEGRKKVKGLSSKYKPKKINKIQVNSQDCLVIQPNLDRDSKMKELKAFFLKTIKGMEKNRIKTIEEKEKKREDYRWKKIVGKAHRKKKDLDELFKTRVIFQQKSDHKVATEPSLRCNQKQKGVPMKLKDEFDDNNMYCPWVFTQEKLNSHYRSKHNQQ